MGNEDENSDRPMYTRGSPCLTGLGGLDPSTFPGSHQSDSNADTAGLDHPMSRRIDGGIRQDLTLTRDARSCDFVSRGFPVTEAVVGGASASATCQQRFLATSTRHQESYPTTHQYYNSSMLDHNMPGSPTHFSNYPMLEDMGALTEARPYPPHDRTDYRMPEFDQHHDLSNGHLQQDQVNYPDPTEGMSDSNPYNTAMPTEDPIVEQKFEPMPAEAKSDSDPASPGRSKPVPKPDRTVTKDENGRYCCLWVGCTEEVKDFARKCEWSKHMDKHDRPYKCPADGCEKLPGFTYSGGLLRHEREVHNKHGGPRKQLNCPHQNCKRHQGKGFSRQENLNEHLRRVHTGTDPENLPRTDETEDDIDQTGMKRKRNGAEDDVREEMKRLKAENEDLKRQVEQTRAQGQEMARQIYQLQQAQQQAAQNHLTGMLQAVSAATQQRLAPTAQMIQ